MKHFVHFRSKRGKVTRQTRLIEEAMNKYLNDHPEEVKALQDRINEARLNLILYGTTEAPKGGDAL